jgi:hypothetical protein
MSRQLHPIPKLKRDTLLYLAGLIDGEGCFFIGNSPKHSRYSTKVYHTPEFKIYDDKITSLKKSNSVDREGVLMFSKADGFNKKTTR